MNDYQDTYEAELLPATTEGQQDSLSTTIMGGGNQALEAAKARVLGEIQGQMVLARQFPRSHIQAMKQIVEACKRPRLAEAAQYEYSRGGQSVSGPSIRLAEAIKMYWGNIKSNWREVERKAGRPGQSTVVAQAWDIETNTIAEREFIVLHQRTTRAGLKFLTDERDIYELLANQAARRVRACILELIPADVVDEAIEQCERTLAGKGGEPLGDRIKKAVGKFDTIGVSTEMIESLFGGKKVDRLSGGELARLARIYKSIEDGVGTVDGFFGDAKSTTTKAKEMFAGDKAPAAASAAKAPAKDKAPAPPATHQAAVPFDGAEAFAKGFSFGDNPFNADVDEPAYVGWGEQFLAASEAKDKK